MVLYGIANLDVSSLSSPPCPLSLLINAFSADTIDLRALNIPSSRFRGSGGGAVAPVGDGTSESASLGGPEALSRDEVEENLTLLLTSARSFGCTLGHSLSVQGLMTASTRGGSQVS